jgi:hypothetical protein
MGISCRLELTIKWASGRDVSACRLELTNGRDVSACRLELTNGRDVSACRLIELTNERYASACRLGTNGRLEFTISVTDSGGSLLFRNGQKLNNEAT